jgi:hypothetical protein
VLFVRGEVTATDGGGAVRTLRPGSPVEVGDVVTTGGGSFTSIRLNDGTRMGLRPRTEFAVEDFKHGAGGDSLVMRLFKGGMRSISGLVAKRNPRGATLKTPVATIGIRGTKFDARLCTGDCADEARALGKQAAPNPSPVVGRVVLLGGVVTAGDETGVTRGLAPGAPLYRGDTVTTEAASYAVLAFKDEGRVTLRAGTRFGIAEYRYEEAEPEKNTVVLRLFQGGMRAITGLVSRNRQRAYRVQLPVATIGIRGTNFDVICRGNCSSASGQSALEQIMQYMLTLLHSLIPDALAAYDDGRNGFGILAEAGDLRVDFANGQSVEINEGRGFFFVDDQQFQLSPQEYQRELEEINKDPAPWNVPVDFRNLFGVLALQGTPPGGYFACYEGHCAVDGVDLGAGEAAYCASPCDRLSGIPLFATLDNWLGDAEREFNRRPVTTSPRAGHPPPIFPRPGVPLGAPFGRGPGPLPTAEDYFGTQDTAGSQEVPGS